MRKLSFPHFAWGLLIYNLLVIVWGAFVRASFSGDGCGAHWPNCGGAVLPNLQHKPVVIEFVHRLSSGLALILVVALVVWAWRKYPKSHPVRLGALASVLFTFSEALVGAALVLYKLVAHNPSMYRAVAMSVHLTNTFILLGCLTLTAWWASGHAPVRISRQGALVYALALGFIGSIVLGISGAVTALGDMLFPAASLLQGLHDDLSPTAHFLVRLRLLHPLIAMSVGLYLLLVASLASHLRPSVHTRRFARWISISFFVQLGAGLVNYLLRAPVWMQLVHLLLADAVWIVFVLLSAAALAENVLHTEASILPPLAPDQEALPAATWRDYITLTKPRVISLLLFTTLAAMFIARPSFLADGWHGIGLFLAVALGGYMAAGAANAVNMVIDRDIDGKMKRTSKRPTVTETIPSERVLWFAFALAAGSFLLLWGAANLLAAMLALAGLVFYVVVYTMLLKRRTLHNIVIGGAAGAFPPLVGWAAVTGNLNSILAWYLFAIIFVWTPVHFWALALLIKDDYASVGIPMLPVVRGDRATVVQIAGYAVLTALVSIMPFFVRHEVGLFYLAAAVLLNAMLLVQSIRLYQKPERPRASSLFHYSMLYLALLFLMMAVDRAIYLNVHL